MISSLKTLNACDWRENLPILAEEQGTSIEQSVHVDRTNVRGFELIVIMLERGEWLERFALVLFSLP